MSRPRRNGTASAISTGLASGEGDPVRNATSAGFLRLTPLTIGCRCSNAPNWCCSAVPASSSFDSGMCRTAPGRLRGEPLVGRLVHVRRDQRLPLDDQRSAVPFDQDQAAGHHSGDDTRGWCECGGCPGHANRRQDSDGEDGQHPESGRHTERVKERHGLPQPFVQAADRERMPPGQGLRPEGNDDGRQRDRGVEPAPGAARAGSRGAGTPAPRAARPLRRGTGGLRRAPRQEASPRAEDRGRRPGSCQDPRYSVQGLLA